MTNLLNLKQSVVYFVQAVKLHSWNCFYKALIGAPL